MGSDVYLDIISLTLTKNPKDETTLEEFLEKFEKIYLLQNENEKIQEYNKKNPTNIYRRLRIFLWFRE